MNEEDPNDNKDDQRKNLRSRLYIINQFNKTAAEEINNRKEYN